MRYEKVIGMLAPSNKRQFIGVPLLKFFRVLQEARLIACWYDTPYRRFVWDPNKVADNLRKHRVKFEDAVLVFDDPLAKSAASRQCGGSCGPSQPSEQRAHSARGRERGGLLAFRAHQYGLGEVKRPHYICVNYHHLVVNYGVSRVNEDGYIRICKKCCGRASLVRLGLVQYYLHIQAPSVHPPQH